MTVTDDLVLLFGLIAVVGLANLALAILDQNAFARERRERKEAEDRSQRTIAGLVSSLEQYGVRPSGVPLTVQNIEAMSNALLRKTVAELAARLRVFEGKNQQDISRLLDEHHKKLRDFDNEEEMTAHWKASQTHLTERWKAYEELYKQEFGQDAIVLWRELQRRTPGAPQPDRGVMLLMYDSLAGSEALDEAAVELERLARLLPADRYVYDQPR